VSGQAGEEAEAGEYRYTSVHHEQVVRERVGRAGRRMRRVCSVYEYTGTL